MRRSSSAKQRRRRMFEVDQAARRRRKFQKDGPVEIQVSILTCNRPDDLRRLLADVRAWSRPYKTAVTIYDDGSDDPWAVMDLAIRQGATVVRSPTPHGRERFASWYNQVIRDLRDHEGWGIILPDDMRLCEDFFERVFDLFGELPDPRGAINPLKDHRSGRNGWGGVPPRETEHLIIDGWVDCMQVARPNFYEALKHEILPTQSRHVGSGVGQQISSRASRASLSLGHPKQSLVVHVGATESVMHPDHRQETPIFDVDFVDGARVADALRSREPVHAHMATIQNRQESLTKVVDSLLDQVDYLSVYLDNYNDPPDCLDHSRINVLSHQPRLGDAGKFMNVVEQGYHLHVDDDLIYPPDYAAKMIRAIERYGRKCACSFHGHQVDETFTDYETGLHPFRCLDTVVEDVEVNILGTGVLGYHSDTIMPQVMSFGNGYMADVWFAVICHRLGIGRRVIAHEQGWIESIPYTDTLWRRMVKNGNEEQSRVVREVLLCAS